MESHIRKRCGGGSGKKADLVIGQLLVIWKGSLSLHKKLICHNIKKIICVRIFGSELIQYIK